MLSAPMNPPTDAAEGTGLIRRCRRISSSISSLWILVLLLLLLPLLPPAQGTLAITHLSLLFIFFIKFTKFVSNPPRKCSICIPFQSKLSRLLLLLSSVFFSLHWFCQNFSFFSILYSIFLFVNCIGMYDYCHYYYLVFLFLILRSGSLFSSYL